MNRDDRDSRAEAVTISLPVRSITTYLVISNFESPDRGKEKESGARRDEIVCGRGCVSKVKSAFINNLSAD